MLHVLESCSYYEELIEYLQECCENTEEFLSGNKMLSYCDEQSLQTNETFGFSPTILSRCPQIVSENVLCFGTADVTLRSFSSVLLFFQCPLSM